VQPVSLTIPETVTGTIFRFGGHKNFGLIEIVITGEATLSPIRSGHSGNPVGQRSRAKYARHAIEYDFSERKGNKHIAEQAHGSADDRRLEAGRAVGGIRPERWAFIPSPLAGTRKALA